MIDALKSLFENNVLSEEIRSDIETAWNNKIQENRVQVTTQLREEFAQKYSHDKQIMIEAVDKLVSDRLAAEIMEFAEDRKSLVEAKARYAVGLREHSDKLQGFIFESLAKEITELHADQHEMHDKFSKLEDFVVESLAKEITDFYNDKQDLANTKVKLVKEAKSQFGKVKSNFVKQSAELVESMITKSLKKEIVTLKEDIDQARENDFGRKIFEAYATEFQHSLLNEKTETSKLLKVIADKDKQLAEAKSIVSEKQRIVESKEREISRTKDIVARKEIMNELLNPLNKEQRSIMNELLESVHTDKLRIKYDTYLPTVLNGKSDVKRTLIEGKEVTGNKTNHSNNAIGQGEVIDIRRLAGLK